MTKVSLESEKSFRNITIERKVDVKFQDGVALKISKIFENPLATKYDLYSNTISESFIKID